MHVSRVVRIAVLTVGCLIASASSASALPYAFVGSNNGGGVARFNLSAGPLVSLGTAATGGGMSGIGATPNGKNVYGVGNDGNVYQYTVGGDGQLTAKNPAFVASGTADNQRIVVSPDGRFAYVTSYSSARIQRFSIDQPSGRLTNVQPAYVTGAHMVEAAITPDGNNLYATGGDSGNLYQFRRDTTTGALTAIGTGSVPVNGNFAYGVIAPTNTEAYATNSVTGQIFSFKITPGTGMLTQTNVVGAGNATGMAASPDGQNVYVAENAQGKVAQYAISGLPLTPTLTRLADYTGVTGALKVALNPAGTYVYAPATGGAFVAEFPRSSGGTLGARNNVSSVTGSHDIVIVPTIAGGIVGKTGTVITMDDPDSEASNLSVTLTGGNYVFNDSLLQLTPSGTCIEVASTPGDVSCPAAGVTGVTINGGPGADVINASGSTGAPFTINGGAEVDTIIGSGAGDKLNGDAGDDVLRGGPTAASDRLTGGAGADSLDVGVTDDGIDRAIYDDVARTATTITVGDGTANDGDPTVDGFDNVSDQIESITGSAGIDLISDATAAGKNNTFAGGGGNDTLTGNAGADFLAGGLGNDTFNGGAGSDRVTYHQAGTGYTTSAGVNVTEDGAANDGVVSTGETDNVMPDIEYLFGSDGPDTLNMFGYTGGVAGNSPAPAGVVISGYAGDDTLIATTGRDYLEGGADTDKATCNGGPDILVTIEGPNTGC